MQQEVLTREPTRETDHMCYVIIRRKSGEGASKKKLVLFSKINVSKVAEAEGDLDPYYLAQ